MSNDTEKARILFVDDEVGVLVALKFLFKSRYDITTANSGEEALRYLDNQSFDLVVSDQRMPEMTGVEVLREAKQRCPGAVRILLTGYSDRDAIVDSVNEVEIYRFINKPWDNNNIRHIISDAIDASRHSRPGSANQPNSDSVTTHVDAGVLVISPDADIRADLTELLGDTHPLHFAKGVDSALDILNSHPIGCVVSEAEVNGIDITVILKLLKQHHPDIVTVVVAEQVDVNDLIDLINEGQIYRFLPKPVSKAMHRISIESALAKHAQLRASPDLQQRHRVRPIEEPPAAFSNIFSKLVNRIRALNRA